jgi:hypothetical protein
MPVVLATWKAETWMMLLKARSGKKFATPYLHQYLVMVVYACHPT